MIWFEQVLARLAELLQAAGVPEDKLNISALVIVYLATVLVAILLILLLVRIARGPKVGAVEEPVEAGGSTPEPEPAFDESMPETTPEPGLEPVSEPVPEPASLLERFKAGVAKTRSGLVGRIDSLLSAGRKIDAELFEELEEVLITADLGLQTTQALMKALEQRSRDEALQDALELRGALMEEIAAMLVVPPASAADDSSRPFVLMAVGVNGVGKTTTIGKLARKFAQQGKKVVLGAGDTFRAAAAEQLQAWGERAGVEVVRHDEGADPGAVAFDAARAAVARKADILILDTAGRLHTKVNLMEELKKVRRVLEREISGAPHQTLLVVDATTGQNALTQARQFNEAVGVDGIALTKLDGTAKGGIVVAIACELGLPVCYVGVGEGVDDLQEFNPQDFVEALFDRQAVE